MRDLLVNSWEEFQEIGCYWMQELVRRNLGRHMTYSEYGGVGQSQWGVDLVPSHMDVGVVAQAKRFYSKTLRWADIEQELVKTNKYPGPITDYFVLTTAEKHTSVQDRMRTGYASYTRTQGSFRVFVLYWSDLQNLDFIPEAIQLRIFPSLASQASKLAARKLTLDEYKDSILYARNLIPQLISPSHIAWLETWDFGLGYVLDADFDPIAKLRFEMHRVLEAQAHVGLQDWLCEGRRAELAKCLPAANLLFLRVIEFAHAVVSEASTGERSGIRVLEHGHSDPSAHSRITSSWRLSAKNLVQAYRQVIEGAPHS